MYHTPLRRFSKLDSSTAKTSPIPDDTSSESSRRDVSNGDFLAPTLLQLWRYQPWKTGPRVCDSVIHTVLYGTEAEREAGQPVPLRYSLPGCEPKRDSTKSKGSGPELPKEAHIRTSRPSGESAGRLSNVPIPCRSRSCKTRRV